LAHREVRCSANSPYGYAQLADILATSVADEDESMSADDNDNDLFGSTIEQIDAPSVHAAGPSMQPLLDSEQEDSDESFPGKYRSLTLVVDIFIFSPHIDLQSASDSSDTDDQQGVVFVL